MSGSAQEIKGFFQEGMDTGEVYAGAERRTFPQFDHSPENKALLLEIQEMIPKGCGDSCILPEELRPHLGHAVAIVREKGGSGGIEAGLTKFRDQDKQLEKILSTRTKIIDKAVMVIAIALLILGLKRLGWM